MKAFIVAAGLGTRLRPLTNQIPKCMIPFGNKPLLWYHIMQLKYHGVTEMWVNTHWLADQVVSYFGDGSQFGVKIFYSHEPELLGTSGALTNPASQISQAFKDEDFFVIYGDNFTNCDYTQFLNYHRSKPENVLTIAVQQSPEPWTKGVIEVDSNMRITRLVEKPPKGENKSDLTSAALYICSPKVLPFIPSGFSDFAADIIPQLIANDYHLYAYKLPQYLEDTGTPERYAKAQADMATVVFPDNTFSTNPNI